MAPAWIYNLDGDKIGTSTRPWRLSDYVVALGFASNPGALQRRIQLARSLSVPHSKKREADGDVKWTAKKRKIETAVAKSENAERKMRSGQLSEKQTHGDGEETKVAVKRES